MLDNKQLASELIVRFAGVPEYGRKLIREASQRLLQMAPDFEFTVPQEANSLRELAVEWPMKEDPRMGPDWNDNYLRCLCTAAADRIEQMAETIAFARKIQAELEKLKQEREVLRVENLNTASLVEQLMEIKKERDAMAAALKNRGGCDTCRHCNVEWDQYPCDSCRQDRNYPSWEWKGE